MMIPCEVKEMITTKMKGTMHKRQKAMRIR